MTFDEYLISKKIDMEAFAKAEPTVFQSWKTEFEQMHVNSFTVQKLNLINPIRRKFRLPEGSPVQDKGQPTSQPPIADAPKPVVARPVKPVIKPRPKTDENV